jgi:crotonobetainyl-CoA:carnitine CoA-transferase CaiB-like acyl-CoA transferase
MTGFTWHLRHPGGAPAGLGFAYADMASGYATAVAIVAALWRRRRRGVGASLAVTQLGVTRRLLAAQLADPQSLVEAEGNAAPEGEPIPHGVYRCRDRDGERWIALSVFDDADWARFATAVDEPWARDPRYASATRRRVQRPGLEAAVADWARQYDAEAIAARLQGAAVSAGALADAADLCQRDPQLAARGYFVRAGGAVVDGPMPRLRSTPGVVDAPAPRRGEHSAQVLRQLLGMSDAELDALHAAGVVGRSSM